jgi:deoxycytidylate deaminase
MFSSENIKSMSKKQKDYCDIARDLAKKSDMEKSKHGAVIVNGKKIIGMGYNRYCNINNCNNKNCYTTHAEVDAILNAVTTNGKQSLKNSELYVIRISNREINLSRPSLKLSKPCEACSDFIVKNKIKMVYYSID